MWSSVHLLAILTGSFLFPPPIARLNTERPVVKRKGSSFTVPCVSVLFGFFALSPHLIAQWQWQNPLPQGNNIHSVFFLNLDTGWAAAEAGTIIKTTDRGMSWEILRLPEPLFTFDVFFLNAFVGWAGGQAAIGSSVIIFKTTDGGVSWEPSLSDFGDIRTITFLNDRLGWASGQSSRVWHTSDGGATWVLQIQFPFQFVHALSFVDSLNGWGAGDVNRRVHTTDGGLTWLVDTLAYSLYDIQFIDSLHGWQCGTWKIERTTDGGSTWQLQLDTFMVRWQSIFMLDQITGWAVSEMSAFGGTPGLIVHTTDGGATWAYQQNPTEYSLRGVFFSNSLNGVTVGDVATLLRTTNGGQGWELATQAVSFESFLAVHVLDPSNVWVSGLEGSILHTSNAGREWIVLPSGRSKALKDIFFVDVVCGWTVGDASTILRTSDSGQSWISQTSPVFADWASIDFSHYPVGWIVGGGQLIKSIDGGNSWNDATNTIFASGTRDVQFTSPMMGWIMAGDIFFGSEQAVYRTTDGGSSWETVITNSSDSAFLAMHFVDDSVGWVSSLRYTIFKTADGGNIWQRVPTPVPFGAIYFADRDEGWGASAVTGDIYHTTDGGFVWSSQNSPCVWILKDLEFAGSEFGWAVGPLGTILSTSNGGSTFVQDESSTVPQRWRIYQNYPNPFNLDTFIILEFEKETSTALVEIFNSLGQRIFTLYEGPLGAGRHFFHWSGRVAGTGDIASTGIYFFTVTVENFVTARKMLLLR
jgi:photosystem II stability/assembly factor-like uncharacterized protein